MATRRRRVRLQWEFIDEANSATAELHSGHGSLIPGVSIRLASASEAFYLGNWRITSAVVAAWSDPARKPDAAEMKTLVGTAVVFTADAIRGPRALACAHCGIKSGTIQPTCSFTVLSAKCTSIIRRLTRPRLPQPRFSRFALEDTGDRVR